MPVHILPYLSQKVKRTPNMTETVTVEATDADQETLAHDSRTGTSTKDVSRRRLQSTLELASAHVAEV